MPNMTKIQDMPNKPNMLDLSNMPDKIVLPDEQATENIAKKFALAILETYNTENTENLTSQNSQKTWIIFLQGELAAGKTTFVRGFLRAMGYQGAVKSPTYTLVEPYDISKLTLYHFDLYRLSHPEELEFMGIREYFLGPAICLIEWPERGIGFLPKPDLVLSFNTMPEGRILGVKS